MPVSNNGYNGTQTPNSAASDFNGQTFLVWSILARVRTMTMVKVTEVTNAGGVSPVGFVDLQPLVNQTDGSGNAVPHGVVYQCPYFRLQGGANAIIIDPQVGDIGWAGFADRDISSVIANKGQANPGSMRKFSMADAVYFGGMLNGTPQQYVQFNAGGITITTPNNVTINAAGNIVANAQGNITATAQGNASVSATGTATISGTAGVNINSPAEVNISGSAGVSIITNGNATAAINGSLTATATGPVSLSAPTIALN
jgi:hypothetical protein